MKNIDEEFYKKLLVSFRYESLTRIQAISKNLVELEKEKDEIKKKEILETIYREVHSLKSGARAVNLTSIEKICQPLEDIISITKREKGPHTTIQFDILHKIVDIIEGLIASEGVSKKEVLPLGFDDTLNTLRISGVKLDTLLVQTEELIASKLSIKNRILDLDQLKKEFDESIKEWDSTFDEAYQLKIHIEKRRIYPHELPFREVQDKILDFLNWGHEKLKLTLSKMDAIYHNLEQDHYIFTGNIDNLLEETKKIMMWPFSTLFSACPKIIRDLSRDLKKEVDFEVKGAEIEIDKRILEEMKDVLIHLIRNSIDHGIETPEERLKNHKPRAGLIKITIQNLSGNEILFEFSDDGKGINLENVKEIAIKNNVISKEEADNLKKEEVLMLIFHSGMSTNRVVTDLSGRGLGMAIIQEKVQKVGGRFQIESETGTRIKIYLPLTLATFKGVLIRVVDRYFIIPSANLEKIIRVKPSTIKKVWNSNVISFKKKIVSIQWLDELLGIPREIQEDHGNYFPAFIIGVRKKRIAFLVDEIIDENEILVKNFIKPLVKIKYISAAAILDGRMPVPILNTLEIFHHASRGEGIDKGVYRSSMVSNTEKTKSLSKKHRVLLVEDSITTRLLLKSVLELGGYEVKTAPDGFEAWGLLKSEEFGILVCDIEMPKMNGFELVTKIKEDSQLKNMPIVLVTGRESAEDKARGIELGANAYVLKSSFDSSKLLEIVKRLIF